MPEDKKDNWDKLKDEAIDCIHEFLVGDNGDDAEAMRKVKVATSVISSYTRHEQTESAREQTVLIVGREMTADKDAFAEYIRQSKILSKYAGIKQLTAAK